MPESGGLLDSLRRAVDAVPDDVALRLHLAALLLERGDREDAVAHIASALQLDPANVQARELMGRALATDAAVEPLLPVEVAAEGFDWSAAEDDLGDEVPPMFLPEGDSTPVDPAYTSHDIVTLADVAGMERVKERLEAAFLAPLRNPQLRTLFGKDLRGGLMLYGPPGCGKTYLARAVAGEMAARFLPVSLADVLDMYLGQSERNLREVFDAARRNAPCVLFLDEVDALGQKRSQLTGGGMRGTVNQLLEELDGVSSSNEGVFVLAATNHPWDVDSALRRPGRFDRTLLVPPPDHPARAALLTRELSGRPVAGIDISEAAAATDGFSGADLVHLCQAAAERALLHAARTGNVRMIDMDDLRAVLPEVRPSIGAWELTARNVALFGNAGGEYDELVAYLQQRRVL